MCFITLSIIGMLLCEVSGETPVARSFPLDAYGDSLPDGCLARFGSTRLRHIGPYAVLRFSPDSNKLLSVSTGKLCVWDVASGKLLRKAILGEVDDSMSLGGAIPV